MANTTAYDLLKNKVTAADGVWQKKIGELDALREALKQDNSYTINRRGVTSIDQVASANGGVALKEGKGKNANWYGRYDVWVGPDMTIYYDGTTAGYNAAARKYIAGKEGAINQKQYEVDQAKKVYDDASTALRTYEATSPVAAATVKAATAASNMKTALIVFGIVLLIATVVGIIWYKKRKNKLAAA